MCNESFGSLQIQNPIIFDRVVEVDVLQRLGILISGNDSIAVSNFSSLMDALTFEVLRLTGLDSKESGSFFKCEIKSHLTNLLVSTISCHSNITTLKKIVSRSSYDDTIQLMNPTYVSHVDLTKNFLESKSKGIEKFFVK